MAVKKLSLKKDLELDTLKVIFPQKVDLQSPHLDFPFEIKLKRSIEIAADFAQRYDHVSEKNITVDHLKGCGRYYLNHPEYYLCFEKRWFYSVKLEIFSKNDRDLLDELNDKYIRDYLIKTFHKPVQKYLSTHVRLLDILEGSLFINLRLKDHCHDGIHSEGSSQKIGHRKIDFNNYHLTELYNRNHKECILCKSRKKLIPYTAEEDIRQKMIKYLIEQVKIPEELIDVEVPLSRYTKHSKDRADILVYNNLDEKMPLILIECKSNDKDIGSEKIYEQAERYNKYLHAKISIITNGIDLITYRQIELDKRSFAKKQLTYEQLLKENGVEFVEVEKKVWVKTSLEELNDREKIKNLAYYFDVSVWLKELPNEIIDITKAAVMLLDLLMNESDRLAPMQVGDMKVIKDGGLRYYNYGTSAGVDDFVGNYRYFIIEDNKGNHQIISLAIYKHWILHPPNLMVAIDSDEELSQHTLQIDLLKHITFDKTNFKIWHDGAITAKTGIKRELLFDEVRKNAKDLIQDKKILLGTFNFNKELNWDMPEIKTFISNIVRYSLIRDTVRKNAKAMRELSDNNCINTDAE